MTTPAKIVCNTCSFKYFEEDTQVTSAANPEFMPDPEQTSILVCPPLPPPNPFVAYTVRSCEDCGVTVAIALSSMWLLEE